MQPHFLAAHQASLSITNSQSLLKLMCIESVMSSNQSHLTGKDADAGKDWRQEEKGTTESGHHQLNGHIVVQSLSHVWLLWPHGLQHARLPSPSSPRACSNSCLLSWWYHPTTLSPVIPFSSCLQSFPASGSFPTSQFFASGGQKYWSFTSASVLPMNIQDWFYLMQISWWENPPPNRRR